MLIYLSIKFIGEDDLNLVITMGCQNDTMVKTWSQGDDKLRRTIEAKLGRS
jgi:hypothetical protein